MNKTNAPTYLNGIFRTNASIVTPRAANTQIGYNKPM
jgi:hypothetical protein